MIADHINNIDLYKNLSPDIYAGLVYLKNLDPGIPAGEYKINDNVKAIVAEYTTKPVFEPGYEAHRKAIDIHYPLTGIEKIMWSPQHGMNCHTEYNAEKDVAFFNNPGQLSSVIVGEGIFAIYFPEDTHGPQYYVHMPDNIKKVVIKIQIA